MHDVWYNVAKDTALPLYACVCGSHSGASQQGYVGGTKREDEATCCYLDLLVKFLNDTTMNENTVSVVTDEAMSVDLDLTLFQQQLQF